MVIGIQSSIDAPPPVSFPHPVNSSRASSTGFFKSGSKTFWGRLRALVSPCGFGPAGVADHQVAQGHQPDQLAVPGYQRPVDGPNRDSSRMAYFTFISGG